MAGIVRAAAFVNHVDLLEPHCSLLEAPGLQPVGLLGSAPACGRQLASTNPCQYVLVSAGACVCMSLCLLVAEPAGMLKLVI